MRSRPIITYRSGSLVAIVGVAAKLRQVATEKQDPDHIDWLVEYRAANQRTAAKLYRLLREFPNLAKGSKFGPEANMLIGIAFSLWRAAFLSDKSGRLKDTIAGADLFLEELLANNAIAYSQEKKSRDWTFNYYVSNAKYRIQNYCRKHPGFELKSLVTSQHKERWEDLQYAFEQIVAHFGKEIKKAGAKSK